MNNLCAETSRKNVILYVNIKAWSGFQDIYTIIILILKTLVNRIFTTFDI